MTEQEAFKDAFETWRGEERYDVARQIWHSALEWARSQQEPLYFVRKQPFGIGWEVASKHRYESATNAGWDVQMLYTHPAPIPEGWQLVPKEPTPEMVQAFLGAPASEYDMDRATCGLRRALAAAPRLTVGHNAAWRPQSIVDAWIAENLPPEDDDE